MRAATDGRARPCPSRPPVRSGDAPDASALSAACGSYQRRIAHAIHHSDGARRIAAERGPEPRPGPTPTAQPPGTHNNTAFRARDAIDRMVCGLGDRRRMAARNDGLERRCATIIRCAAIVLFSSSGPSPAAVETIGAAPRQGSNVDWRRRDARPHEASALSSHSVRQAPLRHPAATAQRDPWLSGKRSHNVHSRRYTLTWAGAGAGVEGHPPPSSPGSAEARAAQPAVQPPSTVRAVPVTSAEASEAR